MSTFIDRYSSFHDPFAEGNIVGASDIFPDAFPSLHIDAPPPYSNLKSILNVDSAKSEETLPKDSNDLTYNAHASLAIHGQGTAVANCTAPNCLLFTFSTDDNAELSLYTQITERSVDFWYGPSPPAGSDGFLPSDRVAIKGKVVKIPEPTFLYPPGDYSVRYWLSVDHKNGILRFGRDYTNLSLALYEARLKKEVTGGPWPWIDPKYKFIDKITSVYVQQQGGNLKAPAPLQLVCQPLPVVAKLPPIIVSNDSITLDQLAVGSATVPANLTPECQRLYANVAGASITLDTADFRDFSKAIERSVNTKGLLCWTLLQQKSPEFGYLRITLGADLGNSPGAPYVLEIWPALHASPIHDHGNANAVIKVLQGKIKAYYFTSLHDAQQIGPPANLEKGDITWLDPENYQIHMLSNESRDGSVCCTIQCYTYGANDTRHYETFDYINNKTDHIIHHFEPDSDMPFDEFKAAIKKEWNERVA